MLTSSTVASPASLLGQIARVPVNDPAQLLVGEPATMRLAGALLGALEGLRRKTSVQVMTALLGEPSCPRPLAHGSDPTEPRKPPQSFHLNEEGPGIAPGALASRPAELRRAALRARL